MSQFKSDMNNEFRRYATFIGFRGPDGVWPLQLAQAGFYRSATCQDFQVVCFACGQVLDLRTLNGDPVVEIHRRLSPKCSFVTGSSDNQPVPPVDHAAAFEWLRQNFSFDIFQEGDAAQQNQDVPDSQDLYGRGSVPDDPILPDNFLLSHMVSNLPSLSDLSTLEQSSGSEWDLDSLPMDFLDGFANANLDSVPTTQLFESGSSIFSQQPFGSSLAAPGEILMTDGVSFGEEGTYPEPQMPDSHISQYTNASRVPGNTGELENPEMSRKLTFDDLGIITQQPKRPELALLEKRLETFDKWMGPKISQSKELIAEAGFYYAGYADCCRCFYCGGGLRSWEPQDDPWVEHARWFRTCPYVSVNKGKEFIQVVDNLGRTNQTITMSDVENEMRTSESANSLEINEAQDQQGEEGEMDLQISDDDNMQSEAERLEEENQSLLQPELCKICLDKEVSIVYVPCGHLVTCGNCASAVKTCPVCRETIGGRIRIQRNDA